MFFSAVLIFYLYGLKSREKKFVRPTDRKIHSDSREFWGFLGGEGGEEKKGRSVQKCPMTEEEEKEKEESLTSYLLSPSLEKARS